MQLQAQYPQLSSAADGALSATTLRQVIKAQSVVRREQADQRDVCLRSLLATDVDLARLNSCSSHPGSAWLEAIPYSRALTLPDFSFRTAGMLRLGARAFLPGAPAVPCTSCNNQVRGNDLIHTLSCPSSTKGWIVRHDGVVNALIDCARRACIDATNEQRYSELGSPLPNAALMEMRCS